MKEEPVDKWQENNCENKEITNQVNEGEAVNKTKNSNNTEVSVDVAVKENHNTDTDSEEPDFERKNLKKNGNILSILKYNSRQIMEGVMHCDLPDLNQNRWPINDESPLRMYPKCEVSIPHAIHVTKIKSRFIDVCHMRPKLFDDYIAHIESLNTKFNNAKGQKSVANLKLAGVYPRSVYDLASAGFALQEEFFTSPYDYYYAGGNLAVMPNVPKGLENRILHAGGSKVHDLKISVFNPTLNNLTPVMTDKMNGSSEIFEVQPIDCYLVGHPDLVAIRQKYCITLRQIICEEFSHSEMNNDDDSNCGYDVVVCKYKTQTLQKIRGKKVPFISISQVPEFPYNFLTSDLTQVVSFFDLNVPQFVRKWRMCYKPRTTWNMMRPWQREVVFYANDRNFMPMDMRVPTTEWCKRECSLNRMQYEHCDLITSFAINANKNRIYVGTAHKLHCKDVRYTSNLIQDKDNIASWTHQLENSPIYIDTFADVDNTEYIAIASAQTGDMRICELTPSQNADNFETNYESYVLPYHPITLKECLDYANKTGDCVNPKADLKHRIDSCCMGMKFFNSNSNLESNEDLIMSKLLTVNSVGDILVQNIKKRTTQSQEERVNKYTTSIMCNYESKICSNRSANYSLSKIVNIEGLQNAMQVDALHDRNDEMDIATSSGKLWKRCDDDDDYDDDNEDDEDQDEEGYTLRVNNDIDAAVKIEIVKDVDKDEKDIVVKTNDDIDAVVKVEIDKDISDNKDKDNDNDEKPNVSPIANQSENSWRETEEGISSYKDALTPHILNVWEMSVAHEENDDDDDDNENENENDDKTVIDANLLSIADIDKKLKYYDAGNTSVTDFVAEWVERQKGMSLRTLKRSSNCSDVSSDTLLDVKIEDFNEQPHSTQFFIDDAVENIKIEAPTPKKPKLKIVKGF